MAGLKNCYWNENGRDQAFVNALEERIPEYGYTNNVYVNLFIAMSHLYYDAYNNGGGNIEDCYMRDYAQHIKPYMGDKVKVQAFIYGDEIGMEQMMNAAIAYIQDKNLDFPVYSCWVNHMERKLSMVEPGNDFGIKAEWFKITFGDLDEIKNFARGYQDVSESFVKSTVSNKETVEKNPPIVIKKAEPAGWKVEVEGKAYYFGEYGRFGPNCNDGVVFKDKAAFNSGNGVCYVNEYGFENANENIGPLFEFGAKEAVAAGLEGNTYVALGGYTKQDFIDICDGNTEMARELFDHVDWQAPETLWDEWVRDEVVDKAQPEAEALAAEEPASSLDNLIKHCESERENQIQGAVQRSVEERDREI